MSQSVIRALIIFICCASNALAQQQSSSGDCSPNVSDVGGNVTITCEGQESNRAGLFLFEDPVEGVYFNEWWAIPLRTNSQIRKYGQAEATIKANGKTVEFVGELSMNCVNAKYNWRGVESFYTPLTGEGEIEAVVPQQVYRNFWKLFCRDNLD